MSANRGPRELASEQVDGPLKVTVACKSGCEVSKNQRLSLSPMHPVVAPICMSCDSANLHPSPHPCRTALSYSCIQRSTPPRIQFPRPSILVWTQWPLTPRAIARKAAEPASSPRSPAARPWQMETAEAVLVSERTWYPFLSPLSTITVPASISSSGSSVGGLLFPL